MFHKSPKVSYLSTPEHRHLTESKEQTNSNSRTDRSSSRSSSSQDQQAQVHLQDCENLLRDEWVGLPGGFTKTGHPLLIFPDKNKFSHLHDSDLNILLQYYVSVVPRAEQVGKYHFKAELFETQFSESWICSHYRSTERKLARNPESFYEGNSCIPWQDKGGFPALQIS